MVPALDVARYFLELAARDPVPEGLTPARLQGLLYYTQGWHLGSFGHALFDESLDVRGSGPVVSAVETAVRAAVADDPTRPLKAGELGPCGLPFRERRFVD